MCLGHLPCHQRPSWLLQPHSGLSHGLSVSLQGGGTGSPGTNGWKNPVSVQTEEGLSDIIEYLLIAKRYTELFAYIISLILPDSSESSYHFLHFLKDSWGPESNFPKVTLSISDLARIWPHICLTLMLVLLILAFPGGVSGKELACQCRRNDRRRFDLWVAKIPWRR